MEFANVNSNSFHKTTLLDSPKEASADCTVPPLIKGISSGSISNKDSVNVEYFANERSIKERLKLYFLKNRKSSLRLRLFYVLVKVLACCLYVAGVQLDNNRPPPKICPTCTEDNYTDILDIDAEDYLRNPEVNYVLLVWVLRPWILWVLQVVVAFISICQTALLMYIHYRGNILQLFLSAEVLLECLASFPFMISIFFRRLRYLYVPSFLSCWLAKISLGNLLNDLHRALQRKQSAVGQQIIILVSTLVCLIFTGTCGIQHMQRAGQQRMNLFQSFYFVIVTFSTVGYGEFYADYWMSQLWVIILIVTAFIFLPAQLEQLASTWLERQRRGGEFKKHTTSFVHHVVVCVPIIHPENILDFLNEFFAHHKLQDYYVVLLSPSDLEPSVRMLLQAPIWVDRIIYMKGSALKNVDLERSRMRDADACFILAARNFVDKNTADQHTILRSWAVKDFAPKCPQYVQIFRPENKMHVKHSENVVCEDEFKYAILANNCICPGISTFITLLMHTSRGLEGQHSSEPWHKVYGKHSGNEIYAIKLSSSKFFGEYEGKSFTYASYQAHRKYGVCLIAVKKDLQDATLLLNPGPKHEMHPNDMCYYMSLTKEEQSSFAKSEGDDAEESKKSRIASTMASIGAVALELQSSDKRKGDGTKEEEAKMLQVGPPARRPSIDSDDAGDSTSLYRTFESLHIPSVAQVPEVQSLNSNESPDDISTQPAPPPSIEAIGYCNECGTFCEESKWVKGFPPVTPFVGTSATLCHLLREKQNLCCLQVEKVCGHGAQKTVHDYPWRNSAVIITADHASKGLYNFIVPLRAHYRAAHELVPIVLLIEKKPSNAFLSAIGWFPMVLWKHGSMHNLDDLLESGINLADHMVVVNREVNVGIEEDYLADSTTIIAVQGMSRMFPAVRIITELSHTSNMRFMQFNAKDLYALHQSKVEYKELKRGSHMAYIFRLPFAGGSVFSANMLDTLLYQAFVKDYLIEFVRLLLGIDQAVGSGYLTSVEITEEDMWIRTYGRLYQKLCSSVGDIPIGLYRTKRMDQGTISAQCSREIEAQDDAKIDDHWKRTYSKKYLVSERYEISNMVKSRMEILGLSMEDYCFVNDARGTVSFVVLNPSFDHPLELGDVIYLVKPCIPVLQSAATPNRRRGLRRSFRGRSRSDLRSPSDTRDTPATTNNDGASLTQTAIQIPDITVTNSQINVNFH